ncbi:hypothetical protein LCGC14_2566130, partial [marine sediment metagenome]
IFSTHDRPESLRRAVDSLLRQSLMPDEVIIVDDGAEPIPDDIGDAVMQAALSSLGIDDTAEVIDNLKKVEQEEEAKGNPDAAILRLTRALKEYLGRRQEQ